MQQGDEEIFHPGYMAAYAGLTGLFLYDLYAAKQVIENRERAQKLLASISGQLAALLGEEST